MNQNHNVLDSAALLATLPQLLPTPRRLASPHDAIAALLHTVMSALAFRLIAVADDGPALDTQSNTLPQAWNEHGPAHYTFRYRHEQSSLEFVVKITKLGPRTLINAIATHVRLLSCHLPTKLADKHGKTDKAFSLDIPTQDYVSQSFYPHDLDQSPPPQPLVHGFISSNRVSDLVSQFKLKILQNLIPGLSKEGYAEETDTHSSASHPAQQQQPPPAQPQRPRPPTGPPFPEDDFPPFGIPALPRTGNPLDIGRRDLDPFAATNPFNPAPLFPGNNSGGMIMGPNHPYFTGRTNPNSSGIRGPWGGDGYLPPMGAPPGARFDPVVPFGGGIGLPGRNPHRNRTGEPDNDEFMPPGMVRFLTCYVLVWGILMSARITCSCRRTGSVAEV
jgi:proteasome inhibitor subunit 1 (PI31)